MEAIHGGAALKPKTNQEDCEDTHLALAVAWCQQKRRRKKWYATAHICAVRACLRIGGEWVVGCRQTLPSRLLSSAFTTAKRTRMSFLAMLLQHNLEHRAKHAATLGSLQRIQYFLFHWTDQVTQLRMVQKDPTFFACVRVKEHAPFPTCITPE